MKNTNISLSLNQKELQILHTALCNHAVKVRGLIDQLSETGLPTLEAQQLSNQLRDLSDRMCGLMTE